MAWQNPKTDWSAADGVRDTDFNRIEGNILELHNKSGLTETLYLYVSTSGNDDTGDGSSAAPFKTIGKAIEALPTNLSGLGATINVSAGVYAENVYVADTLGAVTLVCDGAVSINRLVVKSSQLYVGSNLIVTSGIELSGGALFRSSYDITVTGGIELLTGSTFIVTGVLTVSNATNALRANEGSRAYVAEIHGSGNTSGLAAVAGGIVAYNYMDIVATTQRHTATGGRIYSGAQASVPNY